MSSVHRFGAPLVGSQLRGVIYRILRETGEWKGRRRGVKIELALDKEKSPPITWRARVAKQWNAGKADDVTAAIAAIEKLVAIEQRTPPAVPIAGVAAKGIQ